MLPMQLIPPVMDNPWGGTRLSREFGLKTEKKIQAEGWMLSCHHDGESTVSSGEFAGKTLREVLSLHPEYIGTKCKSEQFPLLIKLIDAKDDLSVQVHPDDDYAKRVEGDNGKTEAWYILDCEPGAKLIYGFREKISHEAFEQAVREKKLLDVLNTVEVQKGDMYFIKAGTVHAIGKGILLAEIQQSSNVTYRLYDYDRLVNGKLRDLDVDKAFDVAVCDRPANTGKPTGTRKEYDGYAATELISCELFHVTNVEVGTAYADSVGSDSFVSLIITEGSGSICANGVCFEAVKGNSFFLPAGMGEYTVRGQLDMIRTVL